MLPEKYVYSFFSKMMEMHCNEHQIIGVIVQKVPYNNNYNKYLIIEIIQGRASTAEI